MRTITFGGPKPQAASASSPSSQRRRALDLNELPGPMIPKIASYLTAAGAQDTFQSSPNRTEQTRKLFQEFQDLHALKSISNTVKANLEQDSDIQDEYQSLHSKLENRRNIFRGQFSQNLHLYGPKHRTNLVNEALAMENGLEKNSAIQGLSQSLSALSEVDRNRLVNEALAMEDKTYRAIAIGALGQNLSALSEVDRSRLVDAVVAMRNGQDEADEENKAIAIDGLGRNLSALSEVDRNRLVDAAMAMQHDTYKLLAIEGLRQSLSVLTPRQQSRLMNALNSIRDRADEAWQQPIYRLN